MADVSVFVDHFPKPPLDVADQLKHIFRVLVLEDIGQAPSNDDLSGVLAVQNVIKQLTVILS